MRTQDQHELQEALDTLAAAITDAMLPLITTAAAFFDHIAHHITDAVERHNQ